MISLLLYQGRAHRGLDGGQEAPRRPARTAPELVEGRPERSGGWPDETFLPREECANPGSLHALACGVIAQGKKVAGRPLRDRGRRPRQSRGADPGARHASKQGRGVARPAALQGDGPGARQGARKEGSVTGGENAPCRQDPPSRARGRRTPYLRSVWGAGRVGTGRHRERQPRSTSERALDAPFRRSQGRRAGESFDFARRRGVVVVGPRQRRFD